MLSQVKVVRRECLRDQVGLVVKRVVRSVTESTRTFLDQLQRLLQLSLSMKKYCLTQHIELFIYYYYREC